MQNGGHGGHGLYGGHGLHGAGRGTRWVTSPITELATPITAVTAAVTTITAPIMSITAPVTAVTAPVTADAAQARRADVGTPERGRLRVPHSRSRASAAATLQAWRVVGGAGRCLQLLLLQLPRGLLSPGLGGRDKKSDAATNQRCTFSSDLVGTLGLYMDELFPGLP